MMFKNCDFKYYTGYSRKKWLALRDEYTGINSVDTFRAGGSEVATILGQNKYESNIEYYYRAIGISPRKNINNAATYRGIVQEENTYKYYYRYFNPDEPFVWDLEEHRERFFDNANLHKKVYRTARRCNAIVTNPKYPHLFINYDYIINKNKYTDVGPLELKSQMGAAMDCWEGGINPAYILQLQDQMLIGGFNYGEIFVLRNSEMPVVFPFESMPDLQDQIVEEVNDFAQKVINVKKVLATDASEDDKNAAIFENEPEVQETEAWIEFLKENHKPENEFVVDASEEFLSWTIDYLEKKIQIKHMENALVSPEVKIRNFIRDVEATKVLLPDRLGHVSCKSKLSISPKILTKYKELQNGSIHLY